jgi:hypothetical protein
MRRPTGDFILGVFMINRREAIQASIPMASTPFVGKLENAEKKEKPPTNILRVWRIKDGIECSEEDVGGLIKLITAMRKRAEENGGDQDIAIGGGVSCQVIPFGSGFDAILALTKDKEQCIAITDKFV